jgi:hypothetical protein
MEDFLIYTATWNLKGQTAEKEEIRKFIKKDKFYHMYIIGTEECMRSILTSFFYSNKEGWLKLLQ